jgi:hypothetical protein
MLPVTGPIDGKRRTQVARGHCLLCRAVAVVASRVPLRVLGRLNAKAEAKAEAKAKTKAACKGCEAAFAWGAL